MGNKNSNNNCEKCNRPCKESTLLKKCSSITTLLTDRCQLDTSEWCWSCIANHRAYTHRNTCIIPKCTREASQIYRNMNFCITCYAEASLQDMKVLKKCPCGCNLLRTMSSMIHVSNVCFICNQFVEGLESTTVPIHYKRTDFLNGQGKLKISQLHVGHLTNSDYASENIFALACGKCYDSVRKSMHYDNIRSIQTSSFLDITSSNPSVLGRIREEKLSKSDLFSIILQHLRYADVPIEDYETLNQIMTWTDVLYITENEKVELFWKLISRDASTQVMKHYIYWRKQLAVYCKMRITQINMDRDVSMIIHQYIDSLYYVNSYLPFNFIITPI